MKNRKILKNIGIVLCILIIISLIYGIFQYINYKNPTDKKENEINNIDEDGETGRIEIAKINLSKVFLANERNSSTCIDDSVCAYNWKNNSPDKKDSKLLLGAHNGTGDNAYFNQIEKLSEGNLAYIEYNGEQYKYKMIDKYTVDKSDNVDDLKIKKEPGKFLYLFTEDKKDNYSKYFLVVKFKYISESEIE